MKAAALRRRYGHAESIALTWGEPVAWTHDPERRTWRSAPVTFDLRDAKGRVIGTVANIEEHHERTIYGSGGPQYEGRKLFYVSTSATRDGKSFGAIPRSTPADTLDEAKTLAEKKVAEAKRRYEKAVAKGEGRQFKKG